MIGKKWTVGPLVDSALKQRFPEMSPLTLQLLKNRGLTSQEKIDEFFNPDYSQDIYDPFLFKDMRKAVKRINQALKKKEKIVVYGDYDADGVTSSVLLVTTLKKLGAARVDVYIPHRLTEGYGLSAAAVKEMIKGGVSLIITVDCGISNKNEVKIAASSGVDVIIVDHHHAPAAIPKAHAVLCNTLKNEVYPFKELAGVGMAFKLAQGLFKDAAKNGKKFESFEKWLLDLVAIGTVGDCVTLLGENRTLTKYGLMVLNKTKRVGLRKLIEAARFKSSDTGFYQPEKNYNLKTEHLSFQLVPRLNAAGRIDHANVAYRLLVSDNEGEAKLIADELNHANSARQRVVEELTAHCHEQIKKQLDDAAYVCQGDGWSVGLIGIVAGKIADQYYKPALVFGREGEIFAASGRSIPEFNMIEALEKIKKNLVQFGGHEQACGLKIEGEQKYRSFVADFKSLARRELLGLDLKPAVKIEAEIKLADINWNFYADLEKFEPFGEGNPEPSFLLRALDIRELSLVGAEAKHLRLLVGDPAGEIKKIICFGMGALAAELAIGDKIDVVAQVGVNSWNGNQELQLKALDVRKIKV